MGAYCSQAGYIERFGEAELLQMTDLDNDGAPDDGFLEAAIADAESEVNSYLAQRYDLPLAVVPDVLRARAHDILRYRLFRHRPAEEVRQRYEDAVSWLRRVAIGQASLGVPPTAEPQSDGVAVVRSRGQVFGRDTLERMP